MSGPLRCWMCDVEPLDVYEVTTMSDPEPRFIAGRWPDGDHEHAVQPPTPDQLVDAADRVRARMLMP